MSGSCMDADLALQTSPGAMVVEGTALYGKHYRANNGSVIELPKAPSSYHRFDYATKAWADPRTAATQWPVIRTERDKRLSACDWVVARAVDSGQPVPELWRVYRQALRDVTLQAYPFRIVWPTPPT